MGDALQLECLKARALTFIEGEVSKGRAAIMSDSEGLRKLTTSTLADVLAMMLRVTGKAPYNVRCGCDRVMCNFSVQCVTEGRCERNVLQCPKCQGSASLYRI